MVPYVRKIEFPRLDDRRLGIGTFGSRDRRKVVFAVASWRSEADEKKWSKSKALEIWDDSVDRCGEAGLALLGAVLLISAAASASNFAA